MQFTFEGVSLHCLKIPCVTEVIKLLLSGWVGELFITCVFHKCNERTTRAFAECQAPAAAALGAWPFICFHIVWKGYCICIRYSCEFFSYSGSTHPAPCAMHNPTQQRPKCLTTLSVAKLQAGQSNQSNCCKVRHKHKGYSSDIPCSTSMHGKHL